MDAEVDVRKVMAKTTVTVTVRATHEREMVWRIRLAGLLFRLAGKVGGFKELDLSYDFED